MAWARSWLWAKQAVGTVARTERTNNPTQRRQRAEEQGLKTDHRVVLSASFATLRLCVKCFNSCNNSSRPAVAGHSSGLHKRNGAFRGRRHQLCILGKHTPLVAWLRR